MQLKHDKIKDHIATWWQSWDSNPGRLDTESRLSLTTLLYDLIIYIWYIYILEYTYSWVYINIKMVHKLEQDVDPVFCPQWA